MPDLLDRLKTALADRYAIDEEIGAGGMATVYLAEDPKHHRKVAVKVLRPELAATLGPERFLREIQIAAKLTHPHILPLHDSGEADGFLYYVMPYVEGESLRGRLNKEKQLPVDEAVGITTAVASALDYAHRRDVIHRDIKPENILLHDGQPVVADFGIALAVRAAGGARLTETGLSLGTPHYMSPEQATADRELTGKTDIYSLACVTYEMLTGDPPHTGSTAQAIISKVLTEEPRPVTSVRKTVAPHTEAAVHKALAKLPADRFSTAQQFAEALARPTAGVLAVEPPGAVPAKPAGLQVVGMAHSWVRRNRALTVVAGIAVVAIAVAARGWLPAAEGYPTDVARFQLALRPGERIAEWRGTNIVLSADGKHLVYAGESREGRQLLLRTLDQLEPKPIGGTTDGQRHFFSPDGQWLGFDVDGKGLQKVAIAGGPPIAVTAVSAPGGATWGLDDQVVFGNGSGLSRVPATGGVTPEVVAVADSGTDLRWPELLPGGNAALVTIFSSLSAAQIGVVSLETGRVTPLGLAGTNPRYLRQGFILYATAEQSLLAVPFDVRRLRVNGPPVALLEGVIVRSAGDAEFTVSSNGTLVYLSGSVLSRLVEVDRLGRVTPLVPELRDYRSPRYSPDGRSVAVDIQESGSRDVWIHSAATGTLSRITFRGGIYPVWTPDGKRVAFSSGLGLYWQPADGSGEAELLVSREHAVFEGTWSSDGEVFVFRETRSRTGRDIWQMPLDRVGDAKPLLQTRFDEESPAVSPDGRWLAYSSNESGRRDVYVLPLAGAGGLRQASTEGGQEPVWARDGRELFYRGPDGVVAVRVQTSPTFAIEGQEVLFGDHFVGNNSHANYDVHPDGQRFLMVAPAEQSGQVVVVLNWMNEIRTRLGRGR